MLRWYLRQYSCPSTYRATIDRRMRNAVTEMQYHTELIVNDVFEQALMELKSILITHQLTLQKQNLPMARGIS